MCVKAGLKTVIQDAAASALGKMFNKVASEHGVSIINIVRKEDQVKYLEEEGCKYILNSSAPDFFTQLSNLISLTKPTFYFSAIGGGELVGRILTSMPPHSTCFVYGALGMQNFKYDPNEFLLKMQSVSFFWLGVWQASLTADERKKWFTYVVNDLSGEG